MKYPCDQEQNPLIRAWIWFWYNDTVRLLVLLMGGHLLFTLPLFAYFVESAEARRSFAMFSYLLVACWGVLDNDYETNLRRIGLDAYRNPLPIRKSPSSEA